MGRARGKYSGCLTRRGRDHLGEGRKGRVPRRAMGRQVLPAVCVGPAPTILFLSLRKRNNRSELRDRKTSGLVWCGGPGRLHNPSSTRERSPMGSAGLRPVTCFGEPGRIPGRLKHSVPRVWVESTTPAPMGSPTRWPTGLGAATYLALCPVHQASAGVKAESYCVRDDSSAPRGSP